MLMQTATATTRPDQKSQVAVEPLSFRQLAYACWEQEHFDRVKGAHSCSGLSMPSRRARQSSWPVKLRSQSLRVTKRAISQKPLQAAARAVLTRAANGLGLATSVSRVSPHTRRRTVQFRSNDQLERVHVNGIKIRELRRGSGRCDLSAQLRDQNKQPSA